MRYRGADLCYGRLKDNGLRCPFHGWHFNSVEQSLNQLDSTESKMSQRRADAAVLMAETSLHSAGKAIATADRYQVIVSVDASDLPAAQTSHNPDNTTCCTASNNTTTPTKRPTIRGAGSIASETARRLSCDCSITVNKTANGEPVDIGRKSRIWPSAMERAIKERDQTCIWPGCTQSRHLHIHHIKHWADGGATSVENAACLCSSHHRLVHEGGYTIQRVDHPYGDKNDNQRIHEQFVQQQHTSDISMFEFERVLRNSRESFNAVRKLSPTQYRFRITDAQGHDILSRPNAHITDVKNRPTYRSHSSHQTRDSTRISCDEACPDYLYNKNKNICAQLMTFEAPPNHYHEYSSG